MTRALARSLAAALALSAAGPALTARAPADSARWALAAQTDGDPAEDALRGLVAGIARSWGRGDAAGVLASVSDAGVRLQMPGGVASRQSRRRAEAVLRRLLDDAEGSRTSAGMVSVVGEAPARGFGELLWEGGAEGMPGLVRTVVYLGFELENGRWRLTEIRLL